MIDRTRIDAPRPKQDAQRAAEQAQHDRLDEELPQDVMASGADGHAQADLPRPLGDRDQHDVHDAHAADDQRDQRHDQQQGAHQSARWRTRSW